MIPWVNELLREWARFCAKDLDGMGWPSMTWEARAMRDYGRTHKEKRAGDRPSPVIRTVTDEQGEPMTDWRGRPIKEAIKQMVPQSRPKQSGYNNWQRAELWPPQMESVDAAVKRLPDGLKLIVQVRYLNPGQELRKMAVEGISESRFYRLLHEAHVRLQSQLKD